MKKLILFIAGLFFLVSCGTQKQMTYMHRPLAAEGCTVTWSVLPENGQLNIVATVKSDRLVFSNTPTMMLKNFDGEVLQLEGTSLQPRSETGGIVSSGVIIPISEVSSIAQFPISEYDIPFFKSGISKVRLTTVPLVHEKEFSHDQIGSFLYKALTNAKNSVNEF